MLRRAVSLLAVVLTVMLPVPTVAHPAATSCEPHPTQHDDEITCQGPGTGELDARKGDDDATVAAGAVLDASGLDPREDATAVDGGKGDDRLGNFGQVGASSTSYGFGPKRRKTAVGRPRVDFGPGDTATARGLDGNVGDDQIENDGQVGASAAIVQVGTPFPFKKGRASRGRALATAIEGSAGDDALDNRGDAAASASAVLVKIENGGGAAGGTRESSGYAGATALSGGAGDDRVLNFGTAAADATAVAVGASLPSARSGKKAKGDFGTSAEASATALAGGDGDDRLESTNAAAATATSVAPSVGLAVGVGRNQDARVQNEATSTAVGLAGGVGDDQLLAQGAVEAGASATAVGISGAIVPKKEGSSGKRRSSVDIETKATAGAVVLDGGDGLDQLTNEGAANAQAGAVVAAVSAALAVDEQASAKGKTSAQASAASLAGGAGDDLVRNRGTARAGALAVSAGVGVAFSKTGKGEAAYDGGAGAKAVATGLAGDDDSTDESDSSRVVVDRRKRSFSTTTRHTVTAARGSDVLENEGAVSAAAEAITASGSVAISVEGATQASSASGAEASAAGIDGGAGADRIRNTGTVAAESDAVAAALSVAFSNRESAEAANDGSVSAKASSVGLAGDGDAVDSSERVEVQLRLDDRHGHFERDTRTESAGGADTLVTTGGVSADAHAVAVAGSAAISFENAASADSSSSAEARALAIEAGAGGDTIAAGGTLTASAEAESAGLQVSFSQADGAKAEHEGGSTAVAAATGIAGDGGVGVTSETLRVDRTGVRREWREKSAAGADSIGNAAAIDATALAVSASGSAAISIEKASKSSTHSTATATASGIDGGGAGDAIESSGTLTSSATAVAAGLNVAFSRADEAESSNDGGASATATAVGILGDSGTVRRDTESADLDFGARSVRFALARAEESQAGDDTIANSGAIVSNATAGSGQGSIAISVEGAASTSTEATATADAAGIRAGGGADAIDNSGQLAVSSDATAAALSVAVAPQDDATAAEGLWDGGVTARADAVGIDAEGGRRRRDAANVELDGGALALDLLLSRQESALSGADTILNTAQVDAGALAIAPELAVAVSSEGQAVARANAEAEANAAGVNAGGGADAVTNRGALSADADAIAAQVSVAVSGESNGITRNTFFQGGTEAKATATGIASDAAAADGDIRELVAHVDRRGAHLTASHATTSSAGADLIDNDAAIRADALAVSPSVAVTVTLDEMSGAYSNASAEADAAAIDAGGSDDDVTTAGVLTADATATAVAANVSVAAKGGALAADAIWSGGTQAKARARGIDGDGAVDVTRNAVDLAIGSGGVELALERATRSVRGNDTIANTGDVNASATAGTGAASVAVGLNGVAGAFAAAEAEADAAGIDAGAGDDGVTNTGGVTADADAVAVAVNVGVSTQGSAFAAGGTTATSAARGIDLDGAGTQRSASAVLGISGSGPELSVQTSELAMSGDDTLDNRGAIRADALAVAPTVSVSVSTQGTAISSSAAETAALAAAIDAGGGDDVVTNQATLDVTATSVAAAVDVSVATSGAAAAGGALLGGDTSANVRARGIDGDGPRTSASHDVGVAIDATGGYLQMGATRTAASGDDAIANHAAVDVQGDAVAAGIAVGVSTSGSALATTASVAEADVAALDAGAGDDTLANDALLTAGSTATAAGISVGVSTSSGLGLAVADTEASARTRGIDGDGTSSDRDLDVSLAITASGAFAAASDAKAAASGDDVIANGAAIDAGAVATAAQVAVPVVMNGVGLAITEADALADATAIDGGGASDAIDNSGALGSDATSTAAAIEVAVTAGSGLSLAVGDVDAAARARGIDGDGSRTSSALGVDLAIDGSGASLAVDHVESASSGDDDVTNDAAIETDAVATAATVSVPVTLTGVSVSSAGGTAVGDASAIDLGGADDTLLNSGRLDASTVSTAAAVEVAVTAGGGASLTIGGSDARARARGIDGDGTGATDETNVALGIDGSGASFSYSNGVSAAIGEDAIVNSGEVDASATATGVQVGVAVTVTGVAAAASTGSARADAAAIDGGAGDDAIANTGVLESDAVATGVAVNVSVTPTGVAFAGDGLFAGGVEADARAAGISGDGTGTVDSESLGVVVDSSGAHFDYATSSTLASGADTIANDAAITTDATAVAPSVGVSVAVTGVGVSLTEATSQAAALAIDGGGGDDAITNHGALDAGAVANADSVSVAVSVAGVAAAGNSVWNGGVHSTATAAGIAGDGAASSGSESLAIDATSAGLAVEHVARTASASGDDAIANDGAITADAQAVTVSAAFGVAAEGGAALAVSTSEAESRAAGIDAGGGSDAVDNQAALTVDSGAVAATVNGTFSLVGVAASSDALWDGGTDAIASAAGIDVGERARIETRTRTFTAGGSGVDFEDEASSVDLDGDDVVVSSGALDVEADATTVSANVALSGIFSAAGSTATGDADAAGIVSGSGDDAVTNTGAISAESDTTAVAVGVSAALGGSLSIDDAWDGGVEARASARGIDAGAGADAIANGGGVTTDADADSVGVSVALGGIAAAAVTTAEAEAESTGLAGGAGDDVIDNTAQLDATSDANAVAVNVSFSAAGVAGSADAAWDGGTTATARARGVDAGSENDAVTNSGAIYATTDSDTTSVGVSVVGLLGVGATVTTSTANADSSAIELGAGDDSLVNTQALDAYAESDATSVGVSLTLGGAAVAADSVWDGGTTANAIARGADGGAGSDALTNTAALTATSDAATTSVAASISVVGAAGATSTATADAESAALDAGDGDDAIVNDGLLTARSDADATAVQASITLAGVSASFDSIWDGGTRALADTFALMGGGGADVITNRAALAATSEATTTSVAAAVTLVGATGALAASDSQASAVALGGGDGDDTIVNSAPLTSTANAEADGVSASVGLVGWSASDTSTRATANAAGLDAGAGDDDVTNGARIDATATADAEGTTVGVTLVGASTSSPFIDADTTAAANATGLAAGAGDDGVDNGGELFANATATTDTTNVQISAIGFASADGSSLADARAVGIDGGEGADTLANGAAISSIASASAPVTSVSVTLAGAGFADFGATAEGEAVGVDGGAGDDQITNTGAIALDADGDTDSTSVSVTLAGVADVDGAGEGTARAIGIAGGAGDDTIASLGAISGNATGRAPLRSVSVTLAGVASADLSSTATSEAIGIDGGAGDDDITSTGTIDLSATPESPSSGVSVSIFGAASQDASASSVARATAIAAGAGDDAVSHEGASSLAASAAASSSSTSFTLAGAAAAGGLVQATSAALGIDGGDGADQLANTGTLALSAGNVLSASGSSTAVFGTADGDARVTGDALASGIDGGAGADAISNAGSLTASATTSATANNSATTIFGSGSTQAGIDSTTRSRGLAGGAGDDAVTNSGTLRANATTSASSNASSWTLAGTSAGAGTLSASAEGALFSGGAGADTIRNAAPGDARTTVSASMSASGGGTTIFGNAGAGASVGATASAGGGDAGDDDDDVENQGTLVATASATLGSSAVSFTFAGGSSATASLLGTADAFGLRGGLGDDRVANSGLLQATASSVAGASGGASVTFGTSTAAATVTSSASVAGLEGGAGADLVANDGTLLLIATIGAASSADATSSALFSPSRSSAAAAGASFGVALSGGDGDDALSSSGSASLGLLGTVAASAVADPAANGFLDSDASATAVASLEGAVAYGVHAGSGSDTLASGGDFGVDVAPTASASATADGDGLGGNGSASASSDAGGALGVGFELDAGDDGLDNTGTFELFVRPNASAYALADADEQGDMNGSASADAGGAAALGVHGLNGANRVDNAGTLRVTAAPRAENAYGDTSSTGQFSNVDAGASGTGRASSVSAVGVALGDGANQIENGGSLMVAATPYAGAVAYARGQGIDGEATASTAAQADGALAVGIRAGDGGNVVTNSGVLEVTAAPQANAYSYAYARQDTIFDQTEGVVATSVSTDGAGAIGIDLGDGANLVSSSGTLRVRAAPRADRANNYSGGNGDGGGGTDAVASASATADDATAIGIRAGDGGNAIEIGGGTLEVTAAPYAESFAYADGFGYDGDATASSTARAEGAAAIGIQTGSGDDAVRIDGALVVAASPLASAGGISAPSSYSLNSGEGSLSLTQSVSGASAAGIVTGAGDDAVAIYGSVSATAYGVAATAIDAGDGDDEIALGDGSATLGSVSLGDGDDTLRLIGTPTLSGALAAGLGTNSLVFEGAGSFSNPLAGFANATKLGSGTFSLPSLAQMASLSVDAGVLSLGSPYAMGAGSLFTSRINGDGTFGQLLVSGNVDLAGSITVLQGPGVFVNGTSYDVIAGSSVSGAFSSQTLPPPTALLSFSLQQNPANVRVLTNVLPFSAPAQSSAQRSFAGYLDRIADEADGQLAGLLGSFQQLGTGALLSAYDDIAPLEYQAQASADLVLLGRVLDAPRSRLAVLRNVAQAGGAGASRLDAPVLFAATERARGLPAASGAWLASFGPADEIALDATPGDGGREQAGVAFGVDRSLGGGLALGVSYAQTTSLLGNAREGSAARGKFASSYLSWAGARGAFAGAVLSYGRTRGFARRAVDAASVDELLLSERAAELLSGFAEAGYGERIGAWRLEGFGSLEWRRLDAGRFSERGGDVSALIVYGHREDRLISELGGRVGRSFAREHGALGVQLGAAWLRDGALGASAFEASLAALPGERFALPGARERDALRLRGALGWELGEALTFDARAQADLGDAGNGISGVLQLDWQF